MDNGKEWRIKSRSLWRYEEDDNTKLFREFSNHRKLINSIWAIYHLYGSQATAFMELALEGTYQFKNTDKEKSKDMIDYIL